MDEAQIMHRVLSLLALALTPALFAQGDSAEKRLRDIIAIDAGPGNPHLKKADELFLDAENSVDRAEAMLLVRKAMLETVQGLREVLPRDADNELALRLRRHLLDSSSEIGQAKVSATLPGDYLEFLK